MKAEFDVLVIGAGVIGSAVARELSRYDLRIGVLEKNADVCMESRGRNSAVCHGGYAYTPGSLKARFCVEGNREMGQLSEQLGFRFRRCGKVVVGSTEEDRKALYECYERAKACGAEGFFILDKQQLHELVPAAEGEFAMYSANSGIFDPFEFTIALAENACHNGVRFFLEHEVTGIERDADGIYTVHTVKGDMTAEWIFNCAGLGCGKVSDMLGIRGYRVVGDKGDYIILDKRLNKLLPMPIYPLPPSGSMGVHLTNTIGGSVLVGPCGDFVEDTTDYGVPADNMEKLAEYGSKIWPHIHRKDYIRNYSGILPKWLDENGVIQDYCIEVRDNIAPHAVNLVGIESPGITSAVPIARYAVSLMLQRRECRERADFDPLRKPSVHFCELSREQQQELIAQNPDYGEIICRCETVTKAEILAAIHNPLGAHTLSSIKYRTHAMMGRCQGGYCQMRMEKLLEQELGLQPTQVRYAREGSQLFYGKVREEAE